ncbi:hypothetical protein Hanom_Chr04g00377031 [Helianthus anomalus]
MISRGGRWWRSGGGRQRRWCLEGEEEKVGRCEQTLEDMGQCLCQEEISQAFFNERSARKQTRCNTQTSALRKHKWPEVLLAKKQTPP